MTALDWHGTANTAAVEELLYLPAAFFTLTGRAREQWKELTSEGAHAREAMLDFAAETGMAEVMKHSRCVLLQMRERVLAAAPPAPDSTARGMGPVTQMFARR